MTTPARIGAARNPSARRLIQWTGERMLPWTDDPAIAYEHLHRYLLAAQLAGGKRVLDLGSGEGYGSALLATAASSVVGVDIDAAAVEHARTTYRADGLRFERASVDDLSAFEPAAFDLITCFEVIEHVEAQERVVAEARRVLTSGGLFLCSTPERDAYRARTGEENPFHVRELDEAEFGALLATQFPEVRLWSQITLTGSLLAPLRARSAAPAEALYVGREDDYWDVRDQPEALYLVAAASAEPVPGGATSVLADPDMALVSQARQRVAAVERELRELQLEADARLAEYRAGIEAREADIRGLVSSIDDLRVELLALGDVAGERERKVAELSGRLARLQRIERSLPYRAARNLRRRVRRKPD
jgi:SAM-dependent methyltransferase